MKRDQLFNRLPQALAERELDQGVYFVSVFEAAQSDQTPQLVMSAMVSMGGMNQRPLAEPLTFSFNFDADADVKRLTAVVTASPSRPITTG